GRPGRQVDLVQAGRPADRQGRQRRTQPAVAGAVGNVEASYRAGGQGHAKRADGGDEAAVGAARRGAVDAALGDQAAGGARDAVQGRLDGVGVGAVEVAVVRLLDDLRSDGVEVGVVAGEGAVVGVDAEVLVVDVDDADAIDGGVEVV